MICDDGSTNAVMKVVTNGACEYWIKPFIENQIKNMGQCVARKIFNENKHDQILGILKVKDQSKRGRDDNASYQPLTKKNRISWTSELHEQFLRVVNQLGLNSKILFPIIFIFFLLFSLFVYFKKLYLCTFFSLPYCLEAKPKATHEAMNVPGLTKEQVASHLQVCFFVLIWLIPPLFLFVDKFCYNMSKLIEHLTYRFFVGKNLTLDFIIHECIFNSIMH